MGYVALYNKYRPKTFDDVCGQEKVVKILSSMVLQNKVSNGYLLCGNRGLGKTTLAKIFSKAINCDNVDDNGNPCNECVSCRAVNDGKSMDVIELDAASNRGVDTIRERVINKVQFKPSSRYRIFILDEVHMLTTEAWNAMLKTLEEPPEYCVFLFCTTNPEKIPKTIMSRIQRFNLSDMTNENIVSRLKYISEKESIDVSDDALYSIARYAKGGMRDSISALDQLSTDGETITVETINDMFGLLPEDIVFNLLENIVNKDLKKSIELISTVCDNGKNVSELFDGLSTMLIICSKMLVGISYKVGSSSVLISNDTASKIESLCSNIVNSDVTYYMQTLISFEKDFKYSSDKQLSMICLVSKMIDRHVASATAIPADLEARISRLEKGIVDIPVDSKKTISHINELIGEEKEQEPVDENVSPTLKKFISWTKGGHVKHV